MNMGVLKIIRLQHPMAVFPNLVVRYRKNYVHTRAQMIYELGVVHKSADHRYREGGVC